jgi:hypothetical protein
MQNREPGSGRGGRASGGGATAGGRGRAGGALVQTTATARELAVGDRMCRMTTGCVGSRVNGSMPVNGQIRSTDKSGQRKGADGVETRRKLVQRTGIRRGRPGKGNPARSRTRRGLAQSGEHGGRLRSEQGADEGLEPRDAAKVAGGSPHALDGPRGAIARTPSRPLQDTISTRQRKCATLCAI